MNPYAYVGGNPETDTDPTGQRVLAPDGSTSWTNPGTGAVYVSSPTGTVNTITYTKPWAPTSTTDTVKQRVAGGPTGHNNSKSSTPKDNGEGDTKAQERCNEKCHYDKSVATLKEHLNRLQSLENIAADLIAVGGDIVNEILQSLVFPTMTVISRVLVLFGSLIPHLFSLAIDLYSFLGGTVPQWVVQAKSIINKVALFANLLNTALAFVNFGFSAAVGQIAEGASSFLKGPVATLFGAFVGAGTSSTPFIENRINLYIAALSAKNESYTIGQCKNFFGANNC